MKKHLIKVTIILSMLLLTLIPLSVNAEINITEQNGKNHYVEIEDQTLDWVISFYYDYTDSNNGIIITSFETRTV